VNSWKIILATVIIFGAGVVVGGLLVQHIITLDHPRPARRSGMAASATNHPPTERADLSKPRQPDQLSQQFVQKLDDELQLTALQRDAIHKLIAGGQEQIWTNYVAQTRQVMQEVRQHIREQLNPDQLKVYEKLLKQQTRPPGRRPAGTNNAPATGTNALLLPATNAPAALVAPAVH
jgi:hypothetical protein